LGITVITAEEQMRGRLARIREFQSAGKQVDGLLYAYQMLRETVKTVRSFSILDYDASAHTNFPALRQQKLRIGSQDMRIAAIVLSIGGIVVTRNTQDFAQIQQLEIQNWTV
jgi:tRNA(fMet)-specific endonuclease VapC